VFHFVTEGMQAALEQARAAAGDQDIRLLGGAATIRQFLQARLVDEMHYAVSPILLGSGEHLLAGVREVVYHRSPPLATQHLRISPSHTGSRAGVRGASAMVIQSVLSPESVDALLERQALLAAAR
jgi:hypothetical protein